MELTALIREEEGAYWAEVEELPGCFASGRSLDELKDALEEAVFMYLGEDRDAEAASRPRAGGRGPMQVERMKMLV